MIQDRRFAFIFRFCSLSVAALGLLTHIGIFRGVFLSGAFMYYTIQSNLLAVIFFGILVVKSAKGLREGRRGNAGWYPRLGMIVAVDLLVTLFVFWVLLVPRGLNPGYLFSFDNIAVHTITPLLCLLDYVLFSQPRSLKYRDVYLVCIFPFVYVLITIVARFAGYVYRYSEYLGTGVTGSAPVRFPYFFLDFDALGITVFVYIGVILVFFLLLSHVIYYFDQKVRKPKTQTIKST